MYRGHVALFQDYLSDRSSPLDFTLKMDDICPDRNLVSQSRAGDPNSQSRAGDPNSQSRAGVPICGSPRKPLSVQISSRPYENAVGGVGTDARLSRPYEAAVGGASIYARPLRPYDATVGGAGTGVRARQNGTALESLLLMNAVGPPNATSTPDQRMPMNVVGAPIATSTPDQRTL